MAVADIIPDADPTAARLLANATARLLVPMSSA
jgi:hypothetical protein